jgi:hypothetical protein
MAPHFLIVRASKADRSHPSITVGKHQTVSETVDVSIAAVSDFSIIVAAVYERGFHIDIGPAGERYAMLRQIDRFFGRVEIGHYRIYDLL